ncbi:hypothetical protein [Microlunatus panaciterrae]|nr:hypothetical protein [Microlunatus panaciterrae]
MATVRDVTQVADMLPSTVSYRPRDRHATSPDTPRRPTGHPHRR